MHYEKRRNLGETCDCCNQPIIAILVFSLTALATPTAPIVRADKEDGAPLKDVIDLVRKALEQAESPPAPCPRTDAECFPPLTKIKLELSTTVGKLGGVTVSFLVFTIGHSRSKESSSTLTIELSRPSPKIRTSTIDRTPTLSPRPSSTQSRVIRSRLKSIRN
jgi:hypothetical protein